LSSLYVFLNIVSVAGGGPPPELLSVLSLFPPFHFHSAISCRFNVLFTLSHCGISEGPRDFLLQPVPFYDITFWDLPLVRFLFSPQAQGWFPSPDERLLESSFNTVHLLPSPPPHGRQMFAMYPFPTLSPPFFYVVNTPPTPFFRPSVGSPLFLHWSRLFPPTTGVGLRTNLPGSPSFWFYMGRSLSHHNVPPGSSLFFPSFHLRPP